MRDGKRRLPEAGIGFADDGDHLMRTNGKTLKTDIAIIGAGIVGCAIARKLCAYDMRIAVLEKEEDVGWGTTKANSGIIHAGYAGERDSMKLKLSYKGNLLFKEACGELDIPIKETGSVLNIFKDTQYKELEDLLLQGRQNGLKDIAIIKEKQKIRKLEPNISDKVIACLYAKDAAVTSPYEAAVAIFENASANGVSFLFDHKVDAIRYEESEKCFCLATKKGLVKAGLIINAAGIYSGEVAKMIGDDSFCINIVKGQYILIDKEDAGYINMVNFKMPDKKSAKSKGILVSPTASGNFFVGPDYEKTRRADVSTSKKSIAAIKASVADMYAGIDYSKAITYFAGLRAIADTGDFILSPSKKNRMFIHVAGIQSPGLTCCFSIAEVVESIVKDMKPGLKKRKSFHPIRKRIEKFEDKSVDGKKRLYMRDPLYGEIVCRCEKVTEAEVVEAIRRGARTLDGIKFRTRAGMGRCQGGYCAIKVMRILKRETGIAFEKITKCGSDSIIAKYKI
jgi:glycerol-3-phosphate dehydrogenase